MRSIVRSVFVAGALCVTLTSPGTAWATSVEMSSSAAVGQTVVSPTLYGSALSGTYYNPTGVEIAGNLYLYAQGGQFTGGTDLAATPWRDCKGDQILLFRVPTSGSSLTSTFPKNNVVRISPCSSDSPAQFPYHTNDPLFDIDHHWTVGGIFDLGTELGLVAAASNYPGATDFSQLVIGWSPDGVQWSWEPFIHSTTGVDMETVVLQASPYSSAYCNPTCHSHRNVWGFFRLGYSGVGRINIDLSSQWPRGYRVTILANDNTWKAVDDNTGAFSFTPKNVWPGAQPKSIVWDEEDDQWELWASYVFGRDPAFSCYPSCGSGYANGDSSNLQQTLKYRPVGTGTTAMGTEQSVFSQIRCMPAIYSFGRMYPFRYDDPIGRRLLYSATNDQNVCSGASFEGMYIVVTEVDD